MRRPSEARCWPQGPVTGLGRPAPRLVRQREGQVRRWVPEPKHELGPLGREPG